jgi:2Fe-2S ferredoxin
MLHVAAAALHPVSDAEQEMLETSASERCGNSRLGCQIKMTEELSGLVVHTPKTQV